MVNGVSGNRFQRFSSEAIAIRMFELALAAGRVRAVPGKVDLAVGSDSPRFPPPGPSSSGNNPGPTGGMCSGSHCRR